MIINVVMRQETTKDNLMTTDTPLVAYVDLDSAILKKQFLENYELAVEDSYLNVSYYLLEVPFFTATEGVDLDD